MTTRSSSSFSSSSVEEEISIPVPNINRTAGYNEQASSNYRAESSTASQHSAIATGTPYDTVSIATTNTGFTNVTANTSVSQQQSIAGSIPIIRPPALNSQEQLSGSNFSTANQPIQIDVASAHQQYQQRGAQAEISPYSGSSTTSSGGSLSSPGSTTQQQQQQTHANAAQTIKAMTNPNNFISHGGVQQQAQNSGQYQYQQTQFANQYSGQQSVNQLLGAHAYNDASLYIDFTAIEAYNIGLQSAGDITAPQSSGQFDVAKAIFTQVDANRDGSISRDEFRHWAQAANPPSYGGQSSYSNYQTTANYGNTDPQIAQILQQSGLTQGYGNYR